MGTKKKKEQIKQVGEQAQKEWKIILYEDEKGCPINDFMKTLLPIDNEKMIRWINYLKSVGNNIRRPQADFLRDKIYELRVILTNNITRTLFFFYDDNEIVLTHTFIKKTQKVPEKEIKKAIKYRKKYLQQKNK